MAGGEREVDEDEALMEPLLDEAEMLSFSALPAALVLGLSCLLKVVAPPGNCRCHAAEPGGADMVGGPRSVVIGRLVRWLTEVEEGEWGISGIGGRLLRVSE